MTAREGRAREVRARTQLGTGAVDDDLDRVRDQHLPEQDHQHEQRDGPSAPSPEPVDANGDADPDDRLGIAEVRERPEHAVGESRGPRVCPPFDGQVHGDDPQIPPDHPGEQADHGARHHDADQGSGEHQPRRGRGVQSRAQEIPRLRMVPELCPDRLGRTEGGIRPGPVAHHEVADQTRADAEHRDHEQHHGVEPPSET
jgi:hypothetical protein